MKVHGFQTEEGYFTRDDAGLIAIVSPLALPADVQRTYAADAVTAALGFHRLVPAVGESYVLIVLRVGEPVCAVRAVASGAPTRLHRARYWLARALEYVRPFLPS